MKSFISNAGLATSFATANYQRKKRNKQDNRKTRKPHTRLNTHSALSSQQPQCLQVGTSPKSIWKCPGLPLIQARTAPVPTRRANHSLQPIGEGETLCFVTVNDLGNEKAPFPMVLRHEMLHDFNRGSKTVYIAALHC